MDEEKVRPDVARMAISEEKQLAKHRRVDYGKVIDKTYDIAEDRQKFFEDPKAERDPLEYPIYGTEPGLVVIFNQVNFERFEKREGSEKDVKELILTLGRLKYNIQERFIFHDLSRREVKKAIENICNMKSMENMNRLICVFLTHGGPENTLETTDGQMRVEEIYRPFCDCDYFKGKPKFFLFQACKAHEVTKQIDAVESKSYHDTRKLVSEKTITDDIPADVLLLYSTIEGEVSFRHKEEGSWFIQELCRNMTAYGRRDDVPSLIIRTTKCVAYGYTYKEEEDDNLAKQLPIFISTLQHKFYITSSKERRFLLAVNKKLNSLQEQIDGLKKRVDSLTCES